MPNFVPSKIIKVVPGLFKSCLTNRIDYKRHGYKLRDKNRVDNFRKECEMPIRQKKTI